MRDDEVYAAWLLSRPPACSGGEVAGLAREDLELDAGRLRVQWTLGMVDGKPT